MGTSLGVLLARNGVPCELVSRDASHIGALKERGATLIENGRESTTPVSALLPQELKGEYDLVILSTRQRENRRLSEIFKPLLGKDGVLLTVQNGLPEESLAEGFDPDRLYGAALGWGAEKTEAGRVRVTSEEYTLALGNFGGGQRTEELVALLRRGGIRVTVGTLREIRYSKLVVNASLSTLSAISGLTFGELSRKYKRLVLSLMRETVAVARASGCRTLIQNGYDIGRLFNSPFAGMILPIAMKKHREIRSGMLKDLEAGRRCDVDFVAGAVVRAGERVGVETPMLRAAVALLHDIENGFAELSPESLKLLFE